MTQLMGRPLLEVPGELGGRPVLADLLAGVRTALVGLALVGVPVLGLWIATPYADSDAAGATRLAGALWLLGHGAPVLRGGADAPLTLTPLLLGALMVVRLYRAGAGVASRRGLRSRWGGPVAVWTGYCAVAVGVVLHCAGPGPFRSRVLPDLLVVGLLAGLSTAAGFRSVRPETAFARFLRSVAVGTGAWFDRLPPDWRPVGGMPAVCRAAAAAGAGLVAAGGLLVAGAAVLDAVTGGGRGMALLGRGPAALSGLLLLTVLLLPNAVLWGAAYALGPGFEVGAGTLVSPGGTELGAVPEFPLFALLPQEGPGGWRLAVLLLPLLAGLVPAVLLGRAAAGRRSPLGTGPWTPAATAVAALAAALLLGAGAAALGWLSGGALAAGRMARLGPVPWWTGLAAAGWLAVVAVPGALLVRHRALGPAGVECADAAECADADECADAVECADGVECADAVQQEAVEGPVDARPPAGGTAGLVRPAPGRGVHARLTAPVRRRALELRARTHALVRRLSGQRGPTG
ncbi:cell division protein PerM [Kitasatospora aureofaciens]|uniref:cell division protein PerM n=1 Tax=Kitasatospora aureofaciens TaxID=1894 RepID=UPI0037CCB613